MMLKEMERLLEKPLWRWQLLWLPSLYGLEKLYLNIIIRRARKENPPGFFRLQYAVVLAAYFHDRGYIDSVLALIGPEIEKWEKRKQSHVYFNIGSTLCDLRYQSDGIQYIEKAIDAAEGVDYKRSLTVLLCMRLNDRGSRDKSLQVVKILANNNPLDPNAKMVIAKAYIDAGRFEDAKKAIEELVMKYPMAYGFLLSELYFAKEDFAAASAAFIRFRVPAPLHFLFAGYSYKKAVTFYRTGEWKRCCGEAARIRRRMKWDKFYSLDDLEEVGIERVTAVDEVIESGEDGKVLIDMEKCAHYVKGMCELMWFWFRMNLYYQLIGVGTFILVYWLVVKLAGGFRN